MFFRRSWSFLLNIMKPQQPPLVVVLGATGAGKSKLAIDIARKFNGEVINADSLQVYQGLDIVTNKVTEEEMDGVPHHLMNFVDPLTPITVVDYRNRAIPLINSLHKQNKIPVLVGGTHYYIEAILWKLLVGADVISQEKFLFDHDQEIKRNDQSSEPLTESEEGLNPETIMQKPIIMSSFPNISSESLHKVLATLDPEVADITHPKDKRKVIRALQIIQRHGQKYSQILDDQRSDQISDSHKLIPLRYKNVVVFWTQSDSTILDKRLDDRVDAMKNAGLLEELQDFHERYKVGREKRGFKPDYTEGIFQAIGFKEFHDYLILPEERRLGRLDLQKEGLWQMKIATKQYARKQIKFIRSRFVSCLERDLPPVFAVDTSYPDKWNEDVRDRAFRVMESLLTTGTFPSDIQPIERPSLTDSEKVTQERKLVHHCEICNVTVQGDKTWQLHCNGKGHQSLLKKLKAETAETQQEREGDARSDNPNQSPPTKIEINQS